MYIKFNEKEFFAFKNEFEEEMYTAIDIFTTIPYYVFIPNSSNLKFEPYNSNSNYKITIVNEFNEYINKELNKQLINQLDVKKGTKFVF